MGGAGAGASERCQAKAVPGAPVMVKAAAKAAAPRAESDWLISRWEKPSDLGGFLTLLQTLGATVASKTQSNLGDRWAVMLRRTVGIDLRFANSLNCFGLGARHNRYERETGPPHGGLHATNAWLGARARRRR